MKPRCRPTQLNFRGTRQQYRSRPVTARKDGSRTLGYSGYRPSQSAHTLQEKRDTRPTIAVVSRRGHEAHVNARGNGTRRHDVSHPLTLGPWLRSSRPRARRATACRPYPPTACASPSFPIAMAPTTSSSSAWKPLRLRRSFPHPDHPLAKRPEKTYECWGRTPPPEVPW